MGIAKRAFIDEVKDGSEHRRDRQRSVLLTFHLTKACLKRMVLVRIRGVP